MTRINNPGQWLFDFSNAEAGIVADGIVTVENFSNAKQLPEVVAVMEKAKHYKADGVFFEASRDGKPPVAQAFIYRSDGSAHDDNFAKLHKQLWSWGGVPLVYRVTNALVQLFRCAHRPDFEKDGQIVLQPFKILKAAGKISNDPWWNADQLRSGTLWDEPEVCKKLLSSKLAAQKTLINAVKELHHELNEKGILPKALRRKLLILSLVIKYLEERKVFEDGFFGRFLKGATEFFEVLADGPALVKLLDHLEDRFNGHVFMLKDDELQTLKESSKLAEFAKFVEARQERDGQLTLWKRYSFADLPVELISHIYQLFVKDTDVAVYTPHFVVRMMLGEVLNWDRLDRLEKNDEVILDGACGSGIFLVEAYKRLVLHWRYNNDWKRPGQTVLKKLLTSRLRGVDLEEGAVELSAFSLCLALCDALEPEEIRTSIKLFPPLKEKTIHTGCFFELREQGVVKGKVGVVVGNPPFASKLGTDGAKRAYARYQENHGELPDKQIAYLFLHESMEMLERGGVLSMLQQYNFLYNQQSLGFRRKFIERWDVREILDFISVRGLFQKGDADTKVIVVVAEARTAPPKREILHATFRRSGRADAEQGFDIDYYDLHWLPRKLALENDGVWRSDLLGGGRVLGFADKLRKYPTLSEFAAAKGWDYGEGYIVAEKGRRVPAKHITGQHALPSDAISQDGIDASKITTETAKLFRSPYTCRRFSKPMVLVHEQFNLNHGIWNEHYLTYQNQIVGFCAKPSEFAELSKVDSFLKQEKRTLQAFVAAASVKLFTQHATTLSGIDVYKLPYPKVGKLALSAHEAILVADIVDYYRDLIRLGEDSDAMKEPGVPALPDFNDVFTARINAVYKKNKLRALAPQAWPGVVCQPYIFGKGDVDWSGAEELKDKLNKLLKEKKGNINIARIARLYDGNTGVYMLKPDRLRYWLRSVAFRDADETLADLVEQGF
jgi:hypothetical protein